MQQRLQLASVDLLASGAYLNLITFRGSDRIGSRWERFQRQLKQTANWRIEDGGGRREANENIDHSFV